MKEADEIFYLFVRDHPSDEQDVRPVVVEVTGDEPTGLALQMREVRDDREHRGAREAECLEIPPVELRVPDREIAAIGVGPQLAPAAEALTRERPVHADEILGRRDVVVDERHPVG